MVNLVIVSHSQRLAEGVKELAEQMSFDTTTNPIGTVPPSPAHRSLSLEQATERNQGVRIAIASAGNQAEECFGTSAINIADAIRAVWTEDGVLLLVDLGSAVLNADLALELLPAEISQKCIISNAPLVEGAVAATLEASLGRTLLEVNRAAESASSHQKI